MTYVLTEQLESRDGAVQLAIEVDEHELQRRPSPGSRATRRTSRHVPVRAFETGMALIRASAEQVASTVRSVSSDSRPEAVEVTLGIKLDGTYGAVIAKAGVEAHLKVVLKWRKAN